MARREVHETHRARCCGLRRVDDPKASKVRRGFTTQRGDMAWSRRLPTVPQTGVNSLNSPGFVFRWSIVYSSLVRESGVW